jgi:hypothetical protein
MRTLTLYRVVTQLTTSIAAARKDDIARPSNILRSLRDSLLQQYVLAGGNFAQHRHAFTFYNDRYFDVAEVALGLLGGGEKVVQVVDQPGDVLHQSSELLLYTHECATELDKFEALDCVIEQASEGDDTDNKTGRLCRVGPLGEGAQ